jgi:alpha-aminoadipate/glutamate carrier protein LysW
MKRASSREKAEAIGQDTLVPALPLGWTLTLELNRLFEAVARGCRMALCPECATDIEVDEELEEGQRLECPECDTTLEVISTNPIELLAVPEADEEE